MQMSKNHQNLHNSQVRLHKLKIEVRFSQENFSLELNNLFCSIDHLIRRAEKNISWEETISNSLILMNLTNKINKINNGHYILDKTTASSIQPAKPLYGK
jgi:hypothetical protein